MQNKISRKEMLKKCGIGALSLGILSFLKPTEALALNETTGLPSYHFFFDFEITVSVFLIPASSNE